MSALPTERRLRGLAAALAVIILAAGAGAAQETGGGATGTPRVLIPPAIGTTPITPPAAAAQGAPLPRGPAPVSVGDLGEIEGPVAGTLSDSNGGLGYNMWEGSDRGAVETLLQRVPADTPSAVSRSLLRKALLTEAPLPVGTTQRPFNALRIAKLLDAGAFGDAGQLAARIRSRDPETQRVQADAMLYAGRDIEACGAATSERLQSAETYWVELRAYCYHFDGDAAALELTRTVMESRGVADASFLHLLGGFEIDTPTPPDGIAVPNAIHVRMLLRQNLPIPANAVNNLGMTVSVLAAASAATPPDIRRAAAEDAFRAGALPPETMRAVLDLAMFQPAELENAATLARTEPFMNALERIRAALRQEARAERRAELIYVAFQVGHAHGLLPQVAALFVQEAEDIVPAVDWDNWASIIARGLLLAGRPAAAARWQNILELNAPGEDAFAKELRIVMALVAPAPLRIEEAQEPLAVLAADSMVPDVTPATMARAVLALGLFDANGLEMPFEAQSQVQALTSIAFPGRRAPPLVMARVEQAARDGRRGELALFTVDAIGPGGAGQVAPDVVVRLVRALREAGLEEEAQALTAEAILTRPDT